MSNSVLINELDVMKSRISDIVADVANTEPLVAAKMSEISAGISQLVTALNDAYIIWEQYDQQGPVPAIDSARETIIQEAFTTIVQLIPGKIGLILSTVQSVSESFAEWAGIELFKLNKDVPYESNMFDDIVFGANASANYSLGGGNDTYLGRGFEVASIVYGQAGNDIIIGGSKNDSLHGNEGNDRIYTSIAGGEAFGEAGDDRLVGDAAADILRVA